MEYLLERDNVTDVTTCPLTNQVISYVEYDRDQNQEILKQFYSWSGDNGQEPPVAAITLDSDDDTHVHYKLDMNGENIIERATYKGDQLLDKLQLRDSKPACHQVFEKNARNMYQLTAVTKFNHTNNTADIITVDYQQNPLSFEKTTVDLATHAVLAQSTHKGLLLNNMPFGYTEPDTADTHNRLAIAPL